MPSLCIRYARLTVLCAAHQTTIFDKMADEMLGNAERSEIARLWERKLDQDARGLPQAERHRNLEPPSAEFICALAAGVGARRILEIGGSSGISTIALAAAARHTGGRLVSIEIEPPRQAQARDVALNEQRQITGVFAGELLAAHAAGCAFVKQSAMQKVDSPFDVVVTSNSGYPLDLNLYQGVKGLSAGARIVKPGGTLILACQCREGVPPGSHYDTLLRSADTPEAILCALAAPDSVRREQWQAQIQALVQRKARVLLYSTLPDEAVRAAHLAPCHDISAAVRECLQSRGNDARVAVLPQGPLTIPYLA